MVTERTYGQYCGLAGALDLVGERSTLLIVRELDVRDRKRYTDSQTAAGYRHQPAGQAAGEARAQRGDRTTPAPPTGRRDGVRLAPAGPNWPRPWSRSSRGACATPSRRPGRTASSTRPGASCLHPARRPAGARRHRGDLRVPHRRHLCARARGRRTSPNCSPGNSEHRTRSISMDPATVAALGARPPHDQRGRGRRRDHRRRRPERSRRTLRRLRAAAPAMKALSPARTQSGHTSQATRDHGRSSPSPSNKLICGGSLPSDDPACPPVPCSGLMKEILGKQMGL